MLSNNIGNLKILLLRSVVCGITATKNVSQKIDDIDIEGTSSNLTIRSGRFLFHGVLSNNIGDSQIWLLHSFACGGSRRLLAIVEQGFPTSSRILS